MGFPTSFTTTYYSGYGAQRPRRTVTHVEGSWVQPTVDCSGDKVSDVSIWVGIDDNGTHYLEQLGTQAYCPSGSAAPIYSAWYEMFPAKPVHVTLTVRAGDHITAFVTKHRSTWTLDLRDLTSGAHFRIHKTRSAAGVQALWVVEAPSTQISEPGQHLLPLADFGRVTFTACLLIVGGVTGDIADPRWAHYRFDMRTSSGATKATTTKLSAGGTSFSSIWRHR